MSKIKRNIHIYGIIKSFKFILILVLALSLILSIGSLFGFQKSFADENELPSTSWENRNEIKLVNPGKLTIAVAPDYPPFSYMDDGKIIGYEAEVWRDIADRMGLTVEEKIMNFDAILAAITSGNQVDIGIAGISIDQERLKLVDFSEPYYDADISFVAKGNSAFNMVNAKTKMSESGVRYAVQSGTTGEMYVHENYPKGEVQAYNNANDCFAAVLAGQADIVCSTSAVNLNLLKSTYKDMRTIREVATGEQYGIAINKENSALKTKINAILANMKEDGTMQKIANSYGLESKKGLVTKGLQTIKCTARPNSAALDSVVGNVATRVTYEAQSAKNEKVSGFQLTFPDDTSFNTDGLTVTMLSGENLLVRSVLASSVTKENNTVVVRFDDMSQVIPGAYFRIEINNVVFPKHGGMIQIDGRYSLSSGETIAIEDIPDIFVEAQSPLRAFVEDISSSEPVKAWNSNKFCNLFLNPGIFLLSIPVVFEGFLMALAIVLCAFPLAIPVGLLLSLMRISKKRIFRGISSVYVNIVRGTPLFLQVYIAFFGLPLAGIKVPTFPLGVFVLAINSSAYLCEIFRGGIQAVPVGQMEAARSLGFSHTKSMIYVVLPQAIIKSIPTLTSEFILLYKDTSLLASVGVMEVVMFAKTIVANTGSITPYIVAALFYLVITLPLAKIVNIIEAKLLRKNTKKKKSMRKRRPLNKDFFGDDDNGKNPVRPNTWGSA